MTLDSMVHDAASGLFIPAQARRQVIPYTDLQALNPPTTNAQISPDLLSALAILAAQAPNGPVLLQADVRNRLRTSSFVNPVTTLQAPTTGSVTSLTVADSSDYYPGQLIGIVAKGAGGNNCQGIIVTGTPDQHTIQCTATCVGINFAVGDFVVGTPDVRVASNVFPNQIVGTNTVILSGAPNPGDGVIGMVGTIGGHKRLMTDPDRSCDSFLRTGLTQPAIPVLTFPAPGAGYTMALKWFNAGMLNNSAAASTPVFQVWNGAAGGGVLIYDEAMSVAVGAVTSLDRPDRLIRPSPNTQMALTFDRGGANLFEWINAGAVLEKA